MNIQDLVYDVLVEEVKNKKLFNFLLKKWFGDNPTPEQMQRAEADLTLFSEKQKSLTPKNPAVYTFLLRHNGTENRFPKFDPAGLMDITRYSLQEIESLLHEFKDDTLASNDEEFSRNLRSTPENVEASKKLWLSDRDTLVNEEGFKVHFVADARESIKYGYYQEYVAESNRGVQWCVTGRNTPESRGNLWGTYRPKRTFWFVIDQSRDPKENADPNIYKYYLTALQYCERDRHPITGEIYTGFKLTSLLNDGDNPMTWEQITTIYPQLTPYRESFQYVRYDETELFDQNVARRLNEVEGHMHEFAAARREYKKSYIDNGGVISTEKSWLSMDDNLKTVYIITSTARDLGDKFPSTELMRAIRSSGNFLKLLDNHIKSLGNRLDDNGRIANKELADLGVSSVYDQLKQKEFDTARTSLDNPKIKLYRSKVTKKKFGLFDLAKNDWVTHDGVTFEDYTEFTTDLYEDDELKQYLVETFVGPSGQVDNQSLFAVAPILENQEFGNCHFIGYRQMQELNKKIHPKNDEDDDDDTIRFKDFDPEKEVDIKEIY
jgi:hypothetical protein